MFDLLEFLYDCRRLDDIRIVEVNQLTPAECFFEIEFGVGRDTRCRVRIAWLQMTGDLILYRRERLSNNSWVVQTKMLARMVQHHNLHVEHVHCTIMHTDDGATLLDMCSNIKSIHRFDPSRLREEFAEAVTAVCGSTNDFLARLTMLDRGFALCGTSRTC